MVHAKHRPLRPPVVACAVFLLAAAAATMMIWRGEQHDRLDERTRVSNLAGDRADALRRNIERAVSVAHALGALIRQGRGTISNFDAVGRQMLPYYPAVSGLSLAPGGIISSVVPLAGNEKIVGQDLLQHPETKKEASIARETGKTTLVGPIALASGETVVVGRLPIYLEDARGRLPFWGFINVAIRVSDAVRAASLPQLTERGIAYELWRIHPDTGQKQIIAASQSKALIAPVEHKLELPNRDWTLSAAPVRGWGDAPGLSLKAALGLLFSLLLADLAKLLLESRAQQQGLEALVARRTAEVQAREADLNRAQSVARVGSWALDFASNKIYGSAEAMRIVGMNRGEPFTFEAYLERVHPDDRTAVDRAWHAAWKGETHAIEYRIVLGTTTRWVHGSVELTYAADGAPQRALGTIQDITERKQAEQALRESAQQLRLFTDNVPAMTAAYDAQLRFRFVNKVFADFYGLAVGDIIGKHVREVIGEAVYRKIKGHLVRALRGHPGTYQCTREFLDGESRYLEVKLLPHFGDQGKVVGCYAVTTDITQHKLAAERIQRLAHHDSLTGLPNRLLFNDRLGQAISLAKRDARALALLYLDLDKFKPVNDTLGHAAGDELLRAVAARIRNEVRESDTVARIGGDEFTVILPDSATHEEAETVAMKIVAALHAPFHLGSRRQLVEIGTSIGIAVYPADARDKDALVTAADSAMYSAKQVGSSYRFARRLKSELSLVPRLHGAPVQKSSQPQAGESR